MSRERRAYRRRSVHWEAVVTGRGGADVDVVIRDFCAGGLFLAPADGNAQAQTRHFGGDITIRLPDPLSGRNREFPAQVVRRMEAGVGVAFARPMPDVVTILAAVAEGHQEGDAASGTAEPLSRLGRQIVDLCHEMVESYCRDTLSDFAHHVVDELFDRARSAPSNADQNAYFTAFRRIKEVRTEITSRYTDALANTGAQAHSKPRKRSESAGETITAIDDLALVDDRQFEDWLNRSEIISRAEKRCSNALDSLNRRIGYVMGRRVDEENNPFGPSALCETLADALPIAELEPKAAQAVYQVFSQVVLDPLDELYAQMNERLREREILPHIEEERPRIHQLGGGARDTEPPEEPEDDDRLREAPATVASGAPETADPVAGTPSWRPGGPPPGARGTSRPHSGSPGLPDAQAVLARYRNLQTSRAAFQRGAEHTGTAQASAAPAVEPTYQSEQVLHAVTSMPLAKMSVPAHPGQGDDRLTQRVLESLGTSDLRTLAPKTRETVEVLDDWFGDVGANALNSAFLRDWSGRVAVLALKLQLQSGSFLSSDPQPIHDLLNQLDRAGIALATQRGDDRETLRRRLDEILQQGLQAGNSDPDAVPTAAHEIAGLVEKPLRARAANMQKVLQQCEGSQKLERARRVVDQEMDKRIARREVPTLLVDFIDKGWRSLLVLIRLRSTGDRKDDWLRGLAVVDRLLAALGTGKSRARPIPQPEKVIGYIEKQLKAFGRMTPELETLLTQIRDYVTAVCRDGRAPRPLPMTRPKPSAPDNDYAASQIDPRWLGQAKLLNTGDWVFFAGKDGTPEPLRLQWVSEERDRYVFVNRSGVKARELSQVELAQQLEAAEAGVAEDMDAPLTERQWQKKLQDMHEEMVRYATHDSLTGLLNRKALLRELDRVPRSKAGVPATHALLYLGVDGFKVVNSTLGHDAGDRLLKDLATSLREATGEAAHAVSRTAGDEFAVLLTNVSASQAEVIAEGCRQRINNYRFGNADNTIAVSVSVGVVSFQTGAQTPQQLLQDGDEACLAAKHAGGNRLHVITPDDRELQQLRSSMERAATVDAALDAGRLELRGQRIVAIGDIQVNGPFYEILIALRGPDNVLVPPDEFIPAAERFGRMTAVDRWVISRVLEWCAAHGDVLETVEGFTINLSGPTLNDAGFARFLREEFERTGVPGGKVCFEVTETTAVKNLARAADLVREVKTLGCRFALDDFGTGLSSYAYLKNLPIDFLKIDGQFIREIDHDEADHAMVRSINELGHFLGKRTIGEYVENDDILAQLREIGLDFAQGYGIARPVPLDDLA
ncbi:MAG TPA: DUF1631 family protein [Gammaproteobacteria bacterium]|nr:DUF1631 family protein [Gammaproteobacteria bacterium]